MQVCPNCHSSMADHATFCTGCGEKLNVQRPAATAGRLHCPQCKSVQITPVVESSVTGAMTAHSGNGGMSATSFSNVHRNYWMCQNCGTKFRNIQNLEEELVTEKKKVTLYSIISAIGAAILLFLIINIIQTGEIAMLVMGPITAGVALVTLVFFCFIFSAKKNVAKMIAESEYLKHNCFN